MTAAVALAKRDVVRFLRQRSRVTGALVTPVAFWALIGLGVGDTFRGPGANGAGYAGYFFPGAVLMVLLFTAIFSTVSVIEDRREGFLQGVLASPTPRGSVVLGKVLGGGALAVGQALLFLLAAPLAGATVTVSSALLLAALLVVGGLALTALGLCVAWPMRSTQGFHVLMNLLLMPMWFLSGALFPLRESLALPLKVLMYANPMTYLLAGLRQALAPGDAALAATLPPVGVCVAVSVLFGIACWALATKLAQRPVTT